MDFPKEMGAGLGIVTVATTSNGGHSPEYYAERLVSRLIHVSDTAPPEIRQQALAFRDQMHALVLVTIKSAILSNHTTIIHHLTQAGMREAAQLVFEMRE
jgi:hypothetical protein